MVSSINNTYFVFILTSDADNAHMKMKKRARHLPKFEWMLLYRVIRSYIWKIVKNIVIYGIKEQFRKLYFPSKIVFAL